MRSGVFLDRDGTLNEDRHFVSDPSELAVLPGTAVGLARLREAGYSLVVTTNQSGIARGLLDPAALARLHERLAELLGVPIDGWFHCPHHPTEGEGPYRRSCDCRKPGSGMITRSARLLGLDLPHCLVIGDSARDILAGAAVGVPGILVRSGKPWREQLQKLARAGVEPLAVADDLPAAVELWLS